MNLTTNNTQILSTKAQEMNLEHDLKMFCDCLTAAAHQNGCCVAAQAGPDRLPAPGPAQAVEEEGLQHHGDLHTG